MKAITSRPSASWSISTVYPCRIPDLFHLLEALGGRCGREADAAAQFGQAEPRVVLQFVEKLSSVAIE
jgi:hypothetical protein